MGARRSDEVEKCVDVACQFLTFNTRTERQVKHKTKEDTKCVCKVETPLSLALPLVMYQQVRSKTLVSMLSTIYLGTGRL